MKAVKRSMQNNRTHKQTDSKIYHNSHPNIQEKNMLYKFTGKERTLTPQHRSTWSPLLFSRPCFVLDRHINLNKERNKRARCLRVDALPINAPPPHLSWENRGGTETTEPGVLEVVWITTKNDCVSPLNKGISSHLIDSERRTMLVRCHETSVSSLQRLQSDGGWICTSRPRVMRLCGTEVTLSHSGQEQNFLTLSLSFLFFALSLFFKNI